MKLKLYQIDAFTNKIFGGNPAAVVPLDQWLPDALMQKIGMENNLAETAFFVSNGDRYELRWFTPTVEVDLCGHATLAAAYVLFHFEGHTANTIQFYSPRSGPLTVTRHGELLTLNFPTDVYQRVSITDTLIACFNKKPKEAFRGKTDYMLVFDDEDAIRNMVPDMQKIASVDGRGIIVTAKGDEVDFVSRFFAPQSGVHEDPVTGSAHTTLTPYWANRLGKRELKAMQLSPRQGHLSCRYLGDRVEISGEGRAYLKGEIEVQ